MWRRPGRVGRGPGSRQRERPAATERRDEAAPPQDETTGSGGHPRGRTDAGATRTFGGWLVSGAGAGARKEGHDG
jgi:hypothetical protein